MATPVAAPRDAGGEKVTIEALTPDLAQDFLANNSGNRPVNMVQVENLARLMEEGLWRFNGDAIRQAKDGTLLDGQHRCMAVVRSKVTLDQQVIVRGLENEAQATMDQGRKRTAADVLGMAGYSNGNQIQSVAKMVHDWKRGKRSISELSKGGRLQLTPDEIRLWVMKDDNLRLAAQVSVRTGLRALCTQKATGTLWFLCNESDPEKTREFFELLESGAGLEKGNPILTVRNYWQNLRVTGHVPVGKYLAAGVRAWNRWMVGEQLSMISQRTDLDIPDIYVAPGKADVANRYLEDGINPSTTPLTLVPGTAEVLAPAEVEKPKPTRPKRKLLPPGGDGSLFAER